jgi:hypothetical protein
MKTSLDERRARMRKAASTLVALVIGAAASTAVAAPTPAPANAPAARPKFRLVANALFLAQTLDYDGTQSLNLYAETGQVNTQYSTKSAVAPDVALQFNFSRNVGVIVAYETASRDGSGNVDASVPHPLYLNRPRTLTTSVSGLNFKQSAIHPGLAVGGGSEKLEYVVFGGPSFYQVDADLIDTFQPQEVYPYDSVTGTFTTAKSSKSAVGFHVGGRLDAWLGRSFGLGAQVRYGSAKVDLGSSGNTTSVTAGGFEVGGGLRLRF